MRSSQSIFTYGWMVDGYGMTNVVETSYERTYEKDDTIYMTQMIHL